MQLPFEPSEGRSADLSVHVVAAFVRSHEVEGDVDVGLHRKQIRHTQQAGVDGGRGLDLECGTDPVALKPEHVDSLNPKRVGNVWLSQTGVVSWNTSLVARSTPMKRDLPVR